MRQCEHLSAQKNHWILCSDCHFLLEQCPSGAKWIGHDPDEIKLVDLFRHVCKHAAFLNSKLPLLFWHCSFLRARRTRALVEKLFQPFSMKSSSRWSVASASFATNGCVGPRRSRFSHAVSNSPAACSLHVQMMFRLFFFLWFGPTSSASCSIKVGWKIPNFNGGVVIFANVSQIPTQESEKETRCLFRWFEEVALFKGAQFLSDQKRVAWTNHLQAASTKSMCIPISWLRWGSI